MSTKTATGKYSYYQNFFNKTLDHYITVAHQDLSKASGWKYYPLKKGSFGYDNMAMSIGHLLDKYKKGVTSLEEASSLIHEGWCENYIYWRDNLPFSTNPDYFKPASPLGDERRNKCSETKFEDLPQDEKDKDIIIAECILKEI